MNQDATISPEAGCRKRTAGSLHPACWAAVVAVHVKLDLEEMQLRLNGEQQRAMLDGINGILKASSPQPNAELRHAEQKD
jgi:hypothetical protein